MCFLSSSEGVRKVMKVWDVAGNEKQWSVQLDVRSLGGHLDFSLGLEACTLAKRVSSADGDLAFTMASQ